MHFFLSLMKIINPHRQEKLQLSPRRKIQRKFCQDTYTYGQTAGKTRINGKTSIKEGFEHSTIKEKNNIVKQKEPY